MGTITIKNLSTKSGWSVITAVAYLMLEGDGAVDEAFGGEINIRKRGNTYTVTDAEEGR